MERLDPADRHSHWIIKTLFGSLLLASLSNCAKPESQPPPPASAKMSPEASADARVDPWDGCKVLQTPTVDSTVITCSRQRMVIRSAVPDLEDQTFQLNAQRYFAQLPGARINPASVNVQLPDGVVAHGSEAEVSVRDESGNDLNIDTMFLGATTKDGSNLLLVCVAKDRANCVADIKQVYAHPPSPSNDSRAPQ